MRVAGRNAEGFRQDRGRSCTDREARGCCPSGRVPRDTGSHGKGCSSLAVLNVGWLDLFRFARKGLVECKPCLTNDLLGAEMWGQL